MILKSLNLFLNLYYQLFLEIIFFQLNFLNLNFNQNLTQNFLKKSFVYQYLILNFNEIFNFIDLKFIALNFRKVKYLIFLIFSINFNFLINEIKYLIFYYYLDCCLNHSLINRFSVFQLKIFYLITLTRLNMIPHQILFLINFLKIKCYVQKMLKIFPFFLFDHFRL